MRMSFVRRASRWSVCAGILATAVGPVQAQGPTEAISVTPESVPAGQVDVPDPGVNVMSADGRFVVFSSHSSTLVPGDTNGRRDVFLRDRLTGKTERVDLGPGGTEANYGGEWPTISADGRYVAFFSAATNLVPFSGPVYYGVFVRDRQAGTLRRLGVDASGTPPNNSTVRPTISANGRYVAFYSLASNFLPGAAAPNVYQLYVQDLQTGATQHVDAGMSGEPAGSEANTVSLSADGRYVAFSSHAPNLVPNDTNGMTDVFVRDRVLWTLERVSVSSDQQQGDSHSGVPAISADGRYVAFSSSATNLAPGGHWPHSGAFVRDLQLGTTKRLSVYQPGVQDPGTVSRPSISADGRYVAFGYYPGGEDATWYVVRRDRVLGSTAWVSLDSAGSVANDQSSVISMTPDGRFVAFTSVATNLVAGDDAWSWDLFVRDNAPGTIGTQTSTLSPQAATFGVQTVGTSSAASLFELRNTGTSPLLIQALRLKGADERRFFLMHTCGASLPAGARCPMRVTFQPTLASAYSATLETIAGNQQSTIRPLTGTGVPGQGEIRPITLGFAPQAVGTTSPAKVVTVANAGLSVLPIKSIYLSGPDARQFVRAKNCPAVLAVGATCTVRVYFKPTSSGTKQATLTVWAGGTVGPKVAAITATGT